MNGVLSASRFFWCAIIVASLSASTFALAKPPSYVTALEGETLQDISARTACPIEDLRLVNYQIKNDQPRPARRVTMPHACGSEIIYEPSSRLYMARKGDTVESVARAHDCKPAAIRKLNKRNHDKMRSGWRIRLPRECRGEDSAAAKQKRDDFAARALRIKAVVDVHEVQEGEGFSTLEKKRAATRR